MSGDSQNRQNDKEFILMKRNKIKPELEIRGVPMTGHSSSKDNCYCDEPCGCERCWNMCDHCDYRGCNVEGDLWLCDSCYKELMIQ